jgi:hypothetical protein
MSLSPCRAVVTLGNMLLVAQATDNTLQRCAGFAGHWRPPPWYPFVIGAILTGASWCWGTAALASTCGP